MGFFTETFFPSLFSRFIELLEAPVLNPGMIWMIIPLVFVLLVMTFYFGKYVKEELGWNTALANSVVLLFVAIDLFRYIFNLTIPPSILNFQVHFIGAIISLIVAVEAISLAFASFFKALPKQVTFFLCSPLPVNLQAYLAIVVVYTNIALDWYTLLAAVILFVILYLFLRLLQFGEGKMIKAVKKEKVKELKQEKKKAKQKVKAANQKAKQAKRQKKSSS